MVDRVTFRSQFPLGTHFMALGHVTNGSEDAGATGRRAGAGRAAAGRAGRGWRGRVRGGKWGGRSMVR